MTGSHGVSATNLLITDLGNHTYRLTFGNQCLYAAITATGSQLERWTGMASKAAGAAGVPAWYAGEAAGYE